MPPFNFLLLPTLILAVGLFAVGFKVVKSRRPAPLLGAWFVFAVAAAVPALLMVVYYGHLLDKSAWFYDYRAVPYSELSASGLGLSAGSMAGWLHRSRFVKGSAFFTHLIPILLLLCLALLLFVPYAKLWIVPLKVTLEDRWSNGVCIQTTPSTCGPSSAATLLNYFGARTTERELARECFSCGTGTENWYIARALRRRGVNAKVQVMAPQPVRIPFPSIAGTEYGGHGGAGHFITILQERDGRYLVGDPIAGRLFLTPDQLHARYYLTGFFMVASGRQRGLPSASSGTASARQELLALHGEVHVHHYRSHVLGIRRRLHVYTPPGYDPRSPRRYPVLYLLHGSPGDDANWTTFGDAGGILDRLITAGQCTPFITVMPDGEVSRKRYGPTGFERDLLRDIVPWVESAYRVQLDSGSRAIAGLSMGGFQSIAIGLNHLESFGSIGIFSAGLREGYVTERDLRAVTMNPDKVRVRLKLLYVRIGKSDFLLGDARRLHSCLGRKSIPHTYQEVAGAHEWPVWRGALEDFAPRLFR